MKAFRPWWTVLPASALVFGACEKKEQQQSAPAAPGEVTPAAAKAAPEAPAPEVKALSAGERAAMLGIVGRLSKDSESVMAIYDGKEIVNRLKSLKSWEFIRETTEELEGMDPEEQMGEGAAEAGKFLGQEIFIATGKGTAPQLANLIKLNQRSSYYQMRMMTQALAAGMGEGDLSGLESASDTAMMEMAQELGKEMATIESAAMPPLLLGIKAADEESLKMAEQQIVSSLEQLPQMAGEAAKPIEFTKGGATFKGYKLSGAFFAEQMEAARADIEEMLKPEDVDRLLATLKTKNLAIASGTVDGYLMLFVGDNEEACPLVDKVEDSLAANDAISFVDGYQGKKLAGFVYGEQGLAKAMVTGTFKDFALGIRDGLTGAENMGDTRELASLLEALGDKEDALLALAKTEALGGLIVLEDGVKFELFGGTDRGASDLEASHSLAGLGASDDVLLFGSWVSNPEYGKRAREYGETFVETAYALAEKIAGLELGEESEFAGFQQGFAMFDEKFRADALSMWGALSTAEGGLGSEGAIVVDLKGTMPPLPGVPQELVDAGKFPRVSLVAPVTDRAKLKEAWTGLDGSLRNVLKTVSELAGEDMPMQKPISSEKDGMTTWFFSMPFFTEDFMPSVTVGDKWFVVSSSKLQALDLAAAAGQSAGERKGVWLELDFDTLRKFTGDWLTLLEKEGEGALGGPEQFAAFKEQLPRIRKGLEAFEEFDQLSVSERREGGRLRTSLHIKVR
jgi:hypothetical protein